LANQTVGAVGALAAANSTAAGRAVENAAPAAPFGPDATSLGVSAIKMAGALFVVLAILFLVYYLLKRYGSRTGLGSFARGDIKYVGQFSLGSKKSVVVVRFLNKLLVLGVTENQINLLTEMEAEHEPDKAETKDDKQDFFRILEESDPEDSS